MSGRPGRLLGGAAIFATLAMLTGCVVVRSWRGEKGADVDNIQPGVKRADAEKVLGPPQQEGVSASGVRYALYEYNAGIPPHYGDAVTAALLDVVTLGIFEIIAQQNRHAQHPGAYDRRTPRVVIAYDARDVILGIFEASAELPPDGRSGPYRWPRVSGADRKSSLA